MRSTHGPSTFISLSGSSPSSVKKLGRCRDVLDHDADVFHPIEGHGIDGRIRSHRRRDPTDRADGIRPFKSKFEPTQR